MNDPGRLADMVSERRVKLHVFEPSQRKVWTVVGSGRERWIDAESAFCSCPGFYFASPGKKSCYHLDSAALAIREGQVETVRFSDDEFCDFVAGLISDL